MHRAAVEEAVAELVALSLQTNEFKDDIATQVARIEAEDAVEDIFRSFSTGEAIVRANEIMTAVQILAITDLGLAPRDADGRVPFSADFAMLQPADPEKGNRGILFDVINRGRKTVLGNFNSVDRSLDPTAPLDPGNGFLMRHGYTVVWCAWQADVPPTPGLMGLSAPAPVGPDGGG